MRAAVPARRWRLPPAPGRRSVLRRSTTRPRSMPSTTSRCCAPSWRSRSIRRRASSCAATTRLAEDRTSRRSASYDASMIAMPAAIGMSGVVSSPARGDPVAARPTTSTTRLRPTAPTSQRSCRASSAEAPTNRATTQASQTTWKAVKHERSGHLEDRGGQVLPRQVERVVDQQPGAVVVDRPEGRHERERRRGDGHRDEGQEPAPPREATVREAHHRRSDEDQHQRQRPDAEPGHPLGQRGPQGGVGWRHRPGVRGTSPPGPDPRQGRAAPPAAEVVDCRTNVPTAAKESASSPLCRLSHCTPQKEPRHDEHHTRTGDQGQSLHAAMLAEPGVDRIRVNPRRVRASAPMRGTRVVAMVGR